MQELLAKPQGPEDSATSSPPQLDQVLTRSSLITIDQPPLEISDSSSGSALVISRQQNYIRRMCLCRPQRSNKKAVWQIGPFALFSHATRSSKHFPDCPYHIRWENTQRYGVEVMLPTSDGRLFVQTFLNWKATGGILPISPGLRVREVVSYNNPAFHAIDSIGSCYFEDGQTRMHKGIDTALMSIRKSFQRRQASPVITNYQGWGLLAVSSGLVYTITFTLNLFKAVFHSVLIYWETFLDSPVAVQSFIDSFRKLIFALNEYGVPFNEQDNCGL